MPGKITMSFLEGCKRKTGFLKNLPANLQKLLFKNRGSPQQKLDQRRQPVSMVDHVQAEEGGRYTDSNFEAARKLQKKLVSENKISQLAMETQQELSVILFEKVKVRSRNEDVGAQITALEGLKARVEELLKRVQEAPNHMQDLTNVQTSLLETRQQIERELTELPMAREILRMQSEIASLWKVIDTLIEKPEKETRDANYKLWASTILDVVVSVAKSPIMEKLFDEFIIPLLRQNFLDMA